MVLFSSDKEQRWQHLGEGVSRKIMSYNEDLMVVQVRFGAGSIGSARHHPHTQLRYVESGVFVYPIAASQFVRPEVASCFIPARSNQVCRDLVAGWRFG